MKLNINNSIFNKILSIILLILIVILPINFVLSNENSEEASNSIGIDYLIIVNSNLSKAVLPLVNLRKSQKLNVEIVYPEDIYKNYTGSDNADKLKQFLKDKYRVWNLKYLLLVGSNSAIPYKMLYPSYLKTDSETEVGRTPSDFYYSDISSDFDSNKNKYSGEYINDKDIDFSTELMVGRIPFDSYFDVSDVVSNIIEFEKSIKSKKALLASTILSYKGEEFSSVKRSKETTDGATLTDTINRDLLKSLGYKVNTLYEKSGISPSIYNNDYPLKKNNFESLLNTNSYDLVLWNGHGNESKLETKIWNSDKNGNKLPDKNELSLNTVLDKNSLENLTKRVRGIFVTGSCSSIKPESENIGQSALKAGFASYIGGTRINWYSENWKNINDGGNQTILYFIIRNIVLRNNTIGEALLNAIQECAEGYQIYGSKDFQNFYSLNLYGDPALRLFPKDFSSIIVNTDSEFKTINLGESLEFLFNINSNSIDDLEVIAKAIDYRKDLFNVFFYPETIKTPGTIRLKIIMAQNIYPTIYSMSVHFKTNSKSIYVVLKFLILPWEKGPQIYLSYSNYAIQRNVEFTIDVCLRKVTNIDTVYVELLFNASILSASNKTVIVRDFLNIDGIPIKSQINMVSSNVIGVYLSRGKFQTGISGEGTVFGVNFRTLKNGYSDVKINRFYIFDPSGKTISAKTFDSKVQVTDDGLFINKNISFGQVTSKINLQLTGSLNTSLIWVEGIDDYLIDFDGKGKFAENVNLSRWNNCINLNSRRDNDEFIKVSTLVYSNTITSILLKIGMNYAVVNDKEISLEVPPIIEQGRTLVPIRFFGESIGANVVWDQNNSSIIISLSDQKVYLWINKKEAIAEKRGIKKTYILDIPPKIINGRTITPLRFIMEVFSAKVEWVDKYNFININYFKN